MLSPVRVKFTVADFYRIIECDILLENAREEIIDGALYRMPLATSPHAALHSKLNELFYRRFDNFRRSARNARSRSINTTNLFPIFVLSEKTK